MKTFENFWKLLKNVKDLQKSLKMTKAQLCDRPTDRRTDGPTDRQSDLKSRVHATKKGCTYPSGCSSVLHTSVHATVRPWVGLVGPQTSNQNLSLRLWHNSDKRAVYEAHCLISFKRPLVCFSTKISTFGHPLQTNMQTDVWKLSLNTLKVDVSS